MIKAGNVIAVIGSTIAVLGMCCMDSEGIGMWIAAGMTIVGLIMAYAGYRRRESEKEEL